MMGAVLVALTIVAVAVNAVPTEYDPFPQTRRGSTKIKEVYRDNGPDKLKDMTPAWVVNRNYDSYVINGTPVPNSKSFPQVATLLVSQRNLISNNAVICTCSIIDARVVLTAAHCVVGNLASWQTYSVCAGTVDMTNDTDYRKCSEAENVWIPEEYNDDAFWLGYDLAVVKLKSSILGPRIRRAKVNFQKPTNNLPGFIVGFGYTVSGGGVDDKMYYTDALIRLNERGYCSYLANTSSAGNKKLICGAGADGNSGSCNGDSGGPLLAKMPQPYQYVVVGVTSFGEQGCPTTSEGVWSSLYDPEHKQIFKNLVTEAGGRWKWTRLPTPTPIPGGCTDSDSRCPGWANNGYCDGVQKPWVPVTCPANCGAC